MKKSKHNLDCCSRMLIAVVVCFLWGGDVAEVAGFLHADQGSSFNLTSAGFAWVTTMDETDLMNREALKDSDAKVSRPLETDAEVGTGFTSIDSMLQWAIDHSDPEKLKSTAQEVQGMTPQQIEKRQSELKEVMEKMRLKSDADLMKISLADLISNSSTAAERQHALQELLILVEPIDNAIDLNKLDGLIVVIGELDRDEEDLRTIAAWVLGTASQNNPVVQNQLLHLGALPKLMKMVGSSDTEEAVKAFFAVSALIRNFPPGQEVFYNNGGALLLQALLSTENLDVRLQKKALFLVADLAEQQTETQNQVEELGDELLKAIVRLTESEDLDTQEKALMAMRSLVRISGAIRDRLRRVGDAEAYLERLRLHFLKLIVDPELADYIEDLEVLRHELAENLSLKSDREHSDALELVEG